MDVVALARNGVDFAVATLGTATTGDHLNVLFRLTDNVSFCFDGDRAGRKAAWRALDNALPHIREGRQIRFVFLPDGHDPDTYVNERGADAFVAAVDGVDAGQGLPFDEGRYVLDAFVVDGIPLALGDDDSEEVAFGFDFPFAGSIYNSVWVNSNGNLTFGENDFDWTESTGEFLDGPPRIAALWDDLSPYNLFSGAQQGLVTFDRSKNSFSVIFASTPPCISDSAIPLATHHRRTASSRLQTWLGPAILVLGTAAFFLWRHAYFGYWLPNTYYAKTGDLQGQLKTG